MSADEKASGSKLKGDPRCNRAYHPAAEPRAALTLTYEAIALDPCVNRLRL